jgi:hypothetical protein
VDEAVTFAKVFDTTLEELLTPPELVTETAVLELLSKYEERYAVAETALAACDEIAVELDELLSRHPEALDALAEAVSKTLPIPADEAGDLRDLKRDVDLFIASRRSSEEQAVAPDRGEPATVYWLSDLFGMAHQRPSNSDDTEGNNGEHQAAT